MSIIIASLLGFLTSLLFPPYFFVPLGFVIFPAICISLEKYLYNINKNKLFILCFIYSFSFFFSFLFWIKDPFYVFDETKNYFYISALLIILLSLILSIIFTIIVKFNRFIPSIFIVPIILIITEYTLSILFFGFPWFSFSLIISSNEVLSFSLKNFGTLVTSFLVLQIFCMPYLFFSEKKNKKIIITFLFYTTLPLLIAFFHNTFFLKETNLDKQKLDIELFQLNKPPINKEYEPYKYMKNILQHIDRSDSKILIFAENNYPYLIKNLNLENIQNKLDKDQIVIIGATRESDGKYYNTLLNITSKEVLYFDKKILVPFGEFLPFRKYLNFFETISGSEDYFPGQKDRIIYISDTLSYIPVICYEIIFYWKLIKNYNHKSNFIINITNDIWFGKYLGPYQHLYLTKIRAAEFNKPILRVSNNGISSLIDKNGKILSYTPLDKIINKRFTLLLDQNINFYKTHEYLKFYFLLLLIFITFINFRKNG